MTTFAKKAGWLLLVLAASVSVSIASADEPTGRWKGRWSSGTTGHSGPMRARITPAGDGTYKAVFAGRFAGVIPFVYRADMQPMETWDGTVYVTEKKLPLLGSYRMNAIIPGSSFNANWSAAGDTGQVSMQRVAN
jgi:hypothetical protein